MKQRSAQAIVLYAMDLEPHLGELAMDVQGVSSLLASGPPYDLTPEQSLFLFTRSDTIYGGSDEIQKNIIGERALGLPREPKPEKK